MIDAGTLYIPGNTDVELFMDAETYRLRKIDDVIERIGKLPGVSVWRRKKRRHDDHSFSVIVHPHHAPTITSLPSPTRIEFRDAEGDWHDVTSIRFGFSIPRPVVGSTFEIT